MKDKSNLKEVARFKIVGASKMTPVGRKMIAAWIRRKADDFERYGGTFASPFSYTYYARTPAKKVKA